MITYVYALFTHKESIVHNRNKININLVNLNEEKKKLFCEKYFTQSLYLHVWCGLRGFLAHTRKKIFFFFWYNNFFFAHVMQNKYILIRYLLADKICMHSSLTLKIHYIKLNGLSSVGTEKLWQISFFPSVPFRHAPNLLHLNLLHNPKLEMRKRVEKRTKNETAKQ